MKKQFQELFNEFDLVLTKLGFSPERVTSCAQIFTQKGCDGVDSAKQNGFCGIKNHKSLDTEWRAADLGCTGIKLPTLDHKSLMITISIEEACIIKRRKLEIAIYPILI
nr:hypothetical protein [Pseudopedobacter sp.]